MKKKLVNVGLILFVIVFSVAVFFLINLDFGKEKVVLDYHSPLDVPDSVIMPDVSQSYKDITIIEAKKLIENNKDNSDFVIIDVSSNYNSGHIVNAINHPIANGSFYRVIKDLDKSKDYLIYSRNDVDSLKAVDELINYDFENIYRLRGNYGAWVEAGFLVGR
ncbi:rhodanese-like domain-containing protein [Candidatus Pacearchaeota archaeon]|nr:rhodanese-like domain-containing protein [Candidatus Pacearchaeota archaeon]